jgi:hypothetical protein
MVPSLLQTSRIAAWLGVIGYMFYTNQNANFLLLCGRVIAQIIGTLVSLRESGSSLSTGSYEYNLQTFALTGLISYAFALWYLYSETHPLQNLLDGRSKEFVALAIAGGFRSFDRVFLNFFAVPSTEDENNKLAEPKSNTVHRIHATRP